MAGAMGGENWAYVQNAAAQTYQGTGTVMGSGSNVAYGLPTADSVGTAHFGVIGWVIVAVVGLALLDKGGFKFVFLAGKG